MDEAGSSPGLIPGGNLHQSYKNQLQLCPESSLGKAWGPSSRKTGNATTKMSFCVKRKPRNAKTLYKNIKGKANSSREAQKARYSNMEDQYDGEGYAQKKTRGDTLET